MSLFFILENMLIKMKGHIFITGYAPFFVHLNWWFMFLEGLTGVKVRGKKLKKNEPFFRLRNLRFS